MADHGDKTNTESGDGDDDGDASGSFKLPGQTKEIRRTQPRIRYRGVPPPPLFDFSKLADEQLLTAREAAAVVRRAQSTLEAWRLHQPDHPLKWRRVAGRVMYEAGSIRAFLRGDC